MGAVNWLNVGCTAERSESAEELLVSPLRTLRCLRLKYVRRMFDIVQAETEEQIDEAKDMGYPRLLFDRYPEKRGKPVKLYRSTGFVETPPYYENPHVEVLFMKLDL